MTENDKILDEKCNNAITKIMYETMTKLKDESRSINENLTVRYSAYMSMISSLSLSITATFIKKHSEIVKKPIAEVISEFVDQLFEALKEAPKYTHDLDDMKKTLMSKNLN